MGVKIDLTGVIFCASIDLDQFRTTYRFVAMTAISNAGTKSSPMLAITGNTIATMIVSAIIFGFLGFSNGLSFTQTVATSVTAPFFTLGMFLYLKTQVDGILLMVKLLGNCTADQQVASVITALTICNGVATLGMDAVYVTVQGLAWLTFGIIAIASCYLFDLAWQAYVGLKTDDNHGGTPDNEQISEFAGKSLIAIGMTSFSALIVLYGDGTAANLELLTPENLVSFTLAGIVGQYFLGLAAALMPQEAITSLAENHYFHLAGIIAFVGLGGYGDFESIEGFLKNYGFLNGALMFAFCIGLYFAIKAIIIKVFFNGDKKLAEATLEVLPVE